MAKDEAPPSAHENLSLTLDELFLAEAKLISQRRSWLKSQERLPDDHAAPQIDLTVLESKSSEAIDAAQSGKPVHRSQVRISATGQDDMELAGLALSGGGVRSAAFCLGALQALNRIGVLDRMDYLSTVSGGGYIGAALSATIRESEGMFAFDWQQGLTGAGGKPRLSDTESVRHIRNYSNYLMPKGATDLFKNLGLLLRGLVTNVFIVAPYLLLAAALTLLYDPDPQSLKHLGTGLPAYVAGKFGLLPMAQVLLSLFRDLLPGFLQQAVDWLARGFGPFTWAIWIAIPFAVFLVAWSFRRSGRSGGEGSEFKGQLASIGAAGLLALLVCLFFTFQNWLLRQMLSPLPRGVADGQEFATVFWTALMASPTIALLVGAFRGPLADFAKDEAVKLKAALAKHASILALWIGAAVMPFLLWLTYVAVVRWGLQCAEALHGPCLTASDHVLPGLHNWLGPYVHGVDLAAIAILLWLPARWISANAYSLHHLYRDRLEKAFIFDPLKPHGLDTNDRASFYPNIKMSDLVIAEADANAGTRLFGPFPIVNAALNVHGSAAVNRRGRNADFFTFTPLSAGSPATGYVRMGTLEHADRDLDLAAAMAISGAAVSSNMGANSIRPLSLTLSLLNVRLGYWLPNPKCIIEGMNARQRLAYLWHEMVSGLDENLPQVLLTDGGHIENLGIYELLRRRCKLIVAVDGEADGEMTFGSLVRLQRYARIDLGIRIDLRWDEIAKQTRKIMKANAGKSGMPKRAAGPHAALGTIFYDDGSFGRLIYIKSSLGGDENDYIRDYASRNPSFPHETTADQFFTEEQFEVYRALGFHATHGALDGKAPVAMTPAQGDDALCCLLRSGEGWKKAFGAAEAMRILGLAEIVTVPARQG